MNYVFDYSVPQDLKITVLGYKWFEESRDTNL